MPTRILATTAAALTLAAGAAQAQVADEIIPSYLVYEVPADLYPRHIAYSARSDSVVYSVGIPSETGGSFAGSGTNVFDDATFGGRFIDNSTPLVLNGMSIGFWYPATFPEPNGTGQMYSRVSFYPTHSSTTFPYPYSGAPVVATIDWTWVISGPIPPGPIAPPGRYISNPVRFAEPFATLSSADVFDGGPTDRTTGVKIELFADAALTSRAVNWQVMRRANQTGYKVGSSDTFAWFSQPADVETGELPQGSRSGGGALGVNARATYMAFLAAMPCPGNQCGTPDFDGDGVLGSDADIQAFFACLTGTCCNSCFCQSGDFNGDGDHGTDADIESFFRVLAGGPC